ncbi:MAG: hypothetical protein PHV34_01850 [Verrucomicrobiae bacterium]|nr:hypothetical protein [Verrucomicrobiae bacterium]
MANDYTPKQFLRLAENILLEEYFGKRGMLTDLDWNNINESVIEPIYAAWQMLPEAKQEEVEQDFRLIFDLASANGTRTLIEEGHCQNLDLVSKLEQKDGCLNKAFWVFLEHRELFDAVYALDQSDHLNGRYWKKRKDMPRKQPDLTGETIKELGDSVGAYYRENQGRGKLCRVEHYLRGNRYHYFFAYPKDYTNTIVGYDNAGRFERKRQTPAFDVIFVYDPADGTLELYAEGDKRLKQDLQKIFARCILHEEISDENPRSIPYELNSLKNPSFAFPTDPADGVMEVRIRELRLALVGNERKRITFHVAPKGAPHDIHDLMTHSLHEHRLPLSMVNVVSAVIQMRFNRDGGTIRPMTVSFRITSPDICNLKDKPEHLVAKKYLKLWGLERV